MNPEDVACVTKRNTHDVIMLCVGSVHASRGNIADKDAQPYWLMNTWKD